MKRLIQPVLAALGLLAVAAAYATEITGPTIKQIKADPETQTFWAFLAALPSSMEAQIFVCLMLSGTVGMTAHYVIRFARNEITGNLFDYLFKDYIRRTILAFSVLVAFSLTSIMSGVFTTDTGVFVGWINVLWFGLTNGYASDSVANKGAVSP